MLIVPEAAETAEEEFVPAVELRAAVRVRDRRRCLQLSLQRSARCSRLSRNPALADVQTPEVGKGMKAEAQPAKPLPEPLPEPLPRALPRAPPGALALLEPATNFRLSPGPESALPQFHSPEVVLSLLPSPRDVSFLLPLARQLPARSRRVRLSAQYLLPGPANLR